MQSSHLRIPTASLLPTALLILFFLLFGSASAETDTAQKTIKHDYKSEFIFPRWKNLHKLNTKPLESDAHRAWLDIYVNNLAKEPYITQSDRFPIGSIVLKPLHTDPQRSETARLVIMMKMQKGYDSQNGDWWYGVYDETGMEGWYQGKIKSCIKCHAHAKETDYMFSETVMESINEEKLGKTGSETD